MNKLISDRAQVDVINKTKKHFDPYLWKTRKVNLASSFKHLLNTDSKILSAILTLFLIELDLFVFWLITMAYIFFLLNHTHNHATKTKPLQDKNGSA